MRWASTHDVSPHRGSGLPVRNGAGGGPASVIGERGLRLGVDADHHRHAGPQQTLRRSPPAGRWMRTARRCTILVKLPVALSGGSSENTEPEAGETLATVPVMSWPASASTLIDDRLAGLEPRELRLLEIGVDIDVRQRHQARQPLAGLHEIADLHRAVADDAVDRRADDGEGQIALGLGQRGLAAPCAWRAASCRCAVSTSTLAMAASSAACALCTPATAWSRLRLRLFQRLPAGELLGGQFLLARQFGFGARLRRPAPKRAAPWPARPMACCASICLPMRATVACWVASLSRAVSTASR